MKELIKLMKLVTEQEKKYEEGLSLHSNFYCYYLIVQQFFQTQLKTQLSQSCRDLFLTISCAFS